ncbi:MAG: GNAT family N-acetyltransferase [Ferruginibacter sp.]
MIRFTTSKTDNDFYEIIALQKENLSKNLSESELKSQGFVTVIHELEDLQKMDTHEHNLVAKEDDKIVGYILAMTQQSKADIPVLVPMFNNFEQIIYKGKIIAEHNFIVVGQVCIQKDYRGKGLFDEVYNAYKKQFFNKYDFAITSIATTNQRSINAHKRVGFVELHSFTDPDNTEWSIVAWDWK